MRKVLQFLFLAVYIKCALSGDGGNEAEIDQYPWLALLEYRHTKAGTIVTKCGGSLISGRYVLTAAHCVHESITNPPESVRLGEHDTRTNIDCDTWYEYAVPYCNEGNKSIPIQNIRIHALYNSRTFENDIALVRLNRTVNFNDFIKPICLPSPSATVPSNLYVAGWGATESGYASPVKMQVMVPYVDLRICHSEYPRLQLSFGRICAGGEIGKSTCYGDSGGPLMRYTEKRYELLGIVSLGLRFCLTGKPGIYTHVTDYLVWLRIHMHE
ncbi:phenoloxidase-activating factor 3-like [Choristoneura fumiferana]|uniref:phenoloxidase-activating factor 3-like n=1 Tax=Choristoneura fumiferana TaxID=7141 RepID=UPI003D15C50B